MPLFSLPPDRIKTRATNKDNHPGVPDLPNPRRQPSEVYKSNKRAEERRRQEEDERATLIQVVAGIEDRYQREDERREAMHKAELNTAKKCPDEHGHGVKLPPEPQTSLESLAPHISKKTPKDATHSVESRSNRSNLPAAPAYKPKTKDIVIDSDDDEDNALELQQYDGKRTSNHSAINRESMRPSEEMRKRKRVATDDDDEGDNDYMDSEDEHASNESRERTRQKKSKKTASRDEIERVRKTRAISGTPAVNQEHIDESAQKGKKATKQKKMKDNTGLIPDWDKNSKKRHAASFTEDSDHNAEEDGDIVRYGGFIPDDETDEVEETAAMKKLTKKATDDKIIVIKPNPLTPKTLVEARHGDKKWAIRHLPQEARADWDTVFAPLLRKKGGASLKPWSFPSIAEIQAVADEVYGISKYKVSDGDVFYGLAITRAQAWRHGFVDAAESAVKDFMHINAKVLDSAENIADYVDYYLSKTKDGETRVYQWKKVSSNTGKQKGFLTSEMICQTLGIAHTSKVAEPAIDFIEEKPAGALVGHVLEQWRDGAFIKSKKEFSAENYDNREDRVPVINGRDMRKVVKKVVTHRTTILFAAIRQFSNDHWDVIINMACEYVPKKTKNKAMKQPKSRDDDVIIIEDESCNPPDFILVEESDASD